MSDQESSDLQADDLDFELDTEVEADEPDTEEETEESQPEAEQGARQEKPKSNYVDLSKIEDAETRKQVEARIGELYRQSRQGELAQENARKLQAQLDALKNQEIAEVPPPSVDDAVDNPERFKQQQKAHAEYLAKKYQQEQAQQAKAQEVEDAKRQEQEARISSYNKRVTELGIDQAQLSAAAAQIQTYAPNMDQDLVKYLLEHEQGPNLVKHLGTDIEDLIAVTKMSPLKAAAYIETVIAPKATQKKKPSAPPPPKRPAGSRGVESPAHKGRTFY